MARSFQRQTGRVFERHSSSPVLVWDQTPYETFLKAVQPHILAARRWLVSNFQRLANSPSFAVRACLLVGLSCVNVFMGAIIYKMVSGVPFHIAAFKVYATVFAVPGADVTIEDSLVSTITLNIIFLVGLLVFAVLLGMVGEEVASHINSLRSGKGHLHLSGHIVLLNWNQQVVPVISQIVAAQTCVNHPFHGRPIVVLAERDRDLMMSDISDVFKRYGTKKTMEVHARHGKPYRVDDLNLISASQAAYILLMYPISVVDKSDAEALKAATVPDEMDEACQQLDVVQHLLRAEGTHIQIVRLSEKSVVDRLIAQTALQPGVVSIYLKILRHGKANVRDGEIFLKKDTAFRWVSIDEEYGSTNYAAVRRLFHGCQVLGYVTAEDDLLHLNPEDECPVHPGDQVLVLQKGRQNLDIEISQDEGIYEGAKKRAASRVEHMDKNLEPPGVNVLMAESPQEVGPSWGRTLHAHFRYLAFADPLSPEALIEGGVETADAVVVLSTMFQVQQLVADSDRMVLSTMFQVQQLVADSDRMVHIVAKASNNNTRKVAKKFFKQLQRRNITFELLIPDYLTSAILTQVASEPLVLQLCHELMMTPDGNELYILEIEQLGFSIGELVLVAEIMEAGKLLQMSLMGYAKRGGTKQCLAPEPSHEVLLEAGDKFVVVADLVN
eukprot:gene27650-7289_t